MADRPETVGDRIRRAREKAGLPRRAVAITLDVTERSIVRWEGGEPVPLSRLAELAGILGVTLGWLVEPAEPKP